MSSVNIMMVQALFLFLAGTVLEALQVYMSISLLHRAPCRQPTLGCSRAADKAGCCAQEEMLNKQAEAARKRREAAEASATPEERVILYAAKQERAKLLQKQEVGPPTNYWRTPMKYSDSLRCLHHFLLCHLFCSPARPPAR